MKKIFLSMASALSFLVVSSGHAQTVVAEWDPSTGSNAGGGVLVPSSPGGSDMEGGPESGANIGPAEGLPDGSAIIFSGGQTEPVRTAAGRQFVFTDGSDLEINFLVEPLEGQSTIFSMADLEVRYDPEEGVVQSILYFDSQGEGPGYKIHRHPITPGSWVKLNIALLGREFTAEVNSLTRRAVITNPLRAKPSSIMLGARVVDNAGARPLKGQIGKVRFTQQ